MTATGATLQDMGTESPLDIAQQLAQRSKTEDLNEADTRHRIIDQMLHGVFKWPRELTRCESYIDPGFADYCLNRIDGTALIVVEAKREGVYFQVPGLSADSTDAKYMQMKVLLTDRSVRDAVSQVHTYCTNKGCQFAAVTNGHQWIFFRTFQAGQDWRDLQAYVIPSLNYFTDHYTDAFNFLNFRSVTQNGSLGRHLGNNPIEHRPIFFPKQDIVAYGVHLHANVYSHLLAPIMKRYFSDLDESDEDFTRSCYVTYKSYSDTFKSARARLTDSLTPYLQRVGVRDVENLETGGAFGTRLARSVTTKRQTEVIVLFGGKGVGKSTFLRRLLFFRPPHILTKHAVCSIVDLLETPSIKDSIHASIWDKIAQDLDKDGVLLADRTRLLELFSDKFEQAKRQSLFGLSESSDLYQTELNKLVASWLQDKKYCAKKLAATWLRKHRGVIVVIDNTDQFPPELQDFCFTIAHEVSRELGALVVISMREERFYSSTIRGTLDAYHNYGFHIASPDPTDVFLRRLRYVISFLAKKQNRIRVWGHEPSGATPQRIVRLLRIFEKEFNSSSSHLAEFLTACAHGDIRYVLSIFRDLVLSRYTNVTEMTSAVDLWTILVHQVLKPLMIPYRFFYSEQESAIPNVFQIRSAKRGSHFTALRILQSLATGDPTQPPFVPVPRIAADFTQVFNMQEEFQLNLDALLRAKMVEADNRMEAYSPDLDSIRITPYGRYMLKELSGYFTYLDLVAVDCGVFSEGLANNLVVLSNQEYELYSAGLDDRGRRVKRVEKRLDKAGAFVKYLVQEEEREIAFYDLQDRPRIALPIAERFAQESANVLRSAKKQKSQRVQFE